MCNICCVQVNQLNIAVPMSAVQVEKWKGWHRRASWPIIGLAKKFAGFFHKMLWKSPKELFG
jgi:hypothetical protein